MGSWNALAWPLLVTNTPDWRPISVGLMNFVTKPGRRSTYDGRLGHHHHADPDLVLLHPEAIYRKHYAKRFEGLKTKQLIKEVANS